MLKLAAMCKRECQTLAALEIKLTVLFHSMYGTTAPSGPWPPSKRASTRPCFQLFSSNLLLLTAVTHPSEPRLPIWFLVFPLVLCCGRFHLKHFLGSSLPPFLLYGPPTLVFWFLYLPRCLDRYTGCTVHYSIWDASVPHLVLGHIFFAVFFSQTYSPITGSQHESEVLRRSFMRIWDMVIPVATRSKARVCGRSLAGIVDSNPVGGVKVCLLWMLWFVR